MVCDDRFKKLCDRVRGEVHSHAVFDSIHCRVFDEFDEAYSAIADRVHKEIDEEYLRDLLADCAVNIQPKELDRAVEIAKVIAFDTRMEAERDRRLAEAIEAEFDKRMDAELASMDYYDVIDATGPKTCFHLPAHAPGGNRTHTTISDQRILSP